MDSFASLGVRAALADVLGKEGITTPFPVQAMVVPEALTGRDICAQAETGSGKTVAFAVPLVQRIEGDSRPNPRGLVLVPTRELALQVQTVVRSLADSAGLRSAAVYGGASPERQLTAFRKGVDIIVATPGRLIDMLQRDAVKLDDIEVVVIDEADRMADFGFMPQVEWILRKVKGRAQMLLLSATLDNEIEGLVRQYLTDPVRLSVSPPDDRENLPAVHRFLGVHELDRVKVVGTISASVARTLVFVRTKRGADRLIQKLAREGVNAAAIHGDLRQSARQKALADFTTGRIPVLVATDVAARGIHVDDVDVVIHFDPPEDHKTYVHRSGRTARAGRTGAVATFVLWNQVYDVERLKKRLGLSEPTVDVLSNDPRLADLAAFAS